MTGISLSVSLRDEEGRTRLAAMLERMDRRQPFFAAAGRLLRGSAGERFDREEDPEGAAWAPLSAARVRQRTREGLLPLTILRANTKGVIGSSLAGSITYEATEEEARIGSPAAYAAIHQLGGTFAMPARTGKIYRKRGEDGRAGRLFAKKDVADVVTEVTIPARTVTIPARPYLGVSRNDEEDILGLAEKWLLS